MEIDMSRLLNWRLIPLERGIIQAVKYPHCGKLLRKGHKLCVNCRQDPRKALVTDQTGGEKIACPKCKSLNEPNSVQCISCGENMVAIKQAKIKDYSVLHKAHKRRKH